MALIVIENMDFNDVRSVAQVNKTRENVAQRDACGQ